MTALRTAGSQSTLSGASAARPAQAACASAEADAPPLPEPSSAGRQGFVVDAYSWLLVWFAFFTFDCVYNKQVG